MTAILAMFVAAELAMVVTCACLLAGQREDARARAEINAADEWLTRIRRAPAVGAARYGRLVRERERTVRA